VIASPPLVSILMPVYQGERWLAEALESAFTQTFSDFELVAVDDGSTDGSVAILEEWSRREPRLRVVHAPHGGLPHAREISLQEAQGRFAAFLDADDTWLPVRLERQLPHADDRTLVFADTYMADEDGAITGTYSATAVAAPDVEWPATGLFSELLRRGNFVPIPTVLAPVRALRDAGSFRRAERAGFGSTGGACDLEMWLNLALRGMKFHYVDEPLTVYRVHAGGMSRQDPVENHMEGLRIVRSLEGEVAGEDRRELRRARRGIQRYLEIAHRKRAWAQLLEQDRDAARRELLASIRARPAALRSWLALGLAHVPFLGRFAALRGTSDA
jgi:teichuronic acid biosynthesis glycosyltransferase TuaG